MLGTRSLRSFPCVHLKPITKPNTVRFAAMAAATASSSSTVEHIVLFKVRDSESSKADAMVSALRALSSLPVVSHIHAGPILRLGSPAASSFAFTHLLHSRYASKADLASYGSDPAHVSVVNSLVLPICEDVLAVDWINPNSLPSSPPPNSAVRLTLAKTKQGFHVSDVVEKVGEVSEWKDAEVSFGENFSPARAKGYDFAMLGVFPGVEAMERFGGSEEAEKAKEVVKPMLDEILVVDFVVEPAGAVPAASM